MSKKNREGLPEAAYIPLARELVKIKKAKKATLEAEKQVKRLMSSAMHAVGVSNFKFEMDGTTYGAKLHRETRLAVDLQRLYGLVRSEQITLDEFLRCVKADNDAILNLFGQDTLNLVSNYDRGPLELTIGEIKQ